MVTNPSGISHLKFVETITEVFSFEMVDEHGVPLTVNFAVEVS